MTSEMTYGAKKTSRNSQRPANRRLSMRAMPSENGIWIASDRKMMIALWDAASWNVASDSARW
jgi:hypothetical protein